MKNLLTIISFTILGSILFSCNSSLTITKRRVNKGFYIASNNQKFSKHVKEEQQKQIVSERPAAPAEAANGLTQPAPEERIYVYEPAELTADAASKPEANASKEVKKVNVPAKNLKNKLAAVKSTKKMIERADFHPKKQIQTMKEKKSTPVDGDDVLSWFWIVILVILILWLIGVLTGGFGMGGLIHLLLVVALILLILWLLGII